MNDLSEEYGLYWQPLGGNNIDQISGHSYRYTDVTPTGRTTVIVDLGKFDNHQALGIKNSAAAVPDIRAFLDDGKDKASAIFLTHSHPDHLNGIVHYIKAGYTLPPLYAGKYTFMILEDLYKEFNIPKQNIHVAPEIVPPAAEAAIRHLKPPEPIILTELIEPDVEKMNQIEEERRKFEEERRKFEEERRKFEEERRRSFIGRKSPRAQFVNSSTPSPDTTQHPSFGGKGVYGRKSPGNKRPMFTISVSSSSASSSSSESEDEIEAKSPQITPKTTINICSSTSDEEELSNSLKEINIKSKEQMYKEQQEKRMAKMEATMQLILEKLDKKERKGIYERRPGEVGRNSTKNNSKEQRKKNHGRTSREPGNKDSTSSFTNNLS